jgi:Flp pilus assembly protein TadB
LWLAVRPQFGVLSEEMQEIAKSNFTGDDLEESLIRFSKRYKSRMLKESVSLIIAGIQSGGELGNLLARIAENIRETQLMQKEISASVMSYVIFIGAATVGAAPVLFALSKQMLSVITQLTSSFGTEGGGASSIGSFSLSFSEAGVSSADFNIFSIVMIGVSCYFAAGIISTIRKGNTHEQVKLFPIFFGVGVLFFFIATAVLSYLFAGFLQ